MKVTRGRASRHGESESCRDYGKLQQIYHVLVMRLTTLRLQEEDKKSPRGVFSIGVIKDVITRIGVIMTFEQIFGIQAGHTLKEVRRSLGTFDDDWKHEEYDAGGNLVARYESWDYIRTGKTHPTHEAGWRKYSPDGALLEKHEDLPL